MIKWIIVRVLRESWKVLRHLGNESETQSNNCQYKKMHRSNHAADSYSEYVSKLESNGVPWSLCALRRNLLECRHGSFCEDDAYTSFADLQVDL